MEAPNVKVGMYLIMMNLQTARQRVSQMLTVWITMLKLAWNQTTAALNDDVDRFR